MKKLTPQSVLADIWFPEDGVDRRSAASLEVGAQAIINSALQHRLLRYVGYTTPAQHTNEWVEPPYVIRGTAGILFNFNSKVVRTLPYSAAKVYVANGRIWVANLNNLRYSDDWGATWSAAIVAPWSGQHTFLLLVSDDNQKILVYASNNTIYLSTNGGSTWTSGAPSPAFTSAPLRGRWWNGRWLAFDGSTLKTSTDGFNWSTVSIAGANIVGGIPYVRNGKLIIPASQIVTTVDGVSYQVEESFFANPSLGISVAYKTRSGQTLYIINSNNGFIVDPSGAPAMYWPPSLSSPSVLIENGLLMNGYVYLD